MRPEVEERVAGEGHAVAVDGGEQRHLVFGVAGRVRDLEFELFPLNFSPCWNERDTLNGSREDAPQVPAARILENVHHVLVAPDLGAVPPDQVRESVHVIVVHVAGHDHVDGLHAVVALERVDGVFDEADAVGHRGGALEVAEVHAAGRAVVDEQRLAAVAHDGVERRGGLMVRHQVRTHREGLVLRAGRVAGLEAVVVAQPLHGFVDGAARVRHNLAVRRAQHLRLLLPQPAQREDAQVDAFAAAVVHLRVVQRVDLAGRVHQVAGEGHRLAVNRCQQRDGAERVPGRGQDEEIGLASSGRCV